MSRLISAVTCVIIATASACSPTEDESWVYSELAFDSLFATLDTTVLDSANPVGAINDAIQIGDLFYIADSHSDNVRVVDPTGRSLAVDGGTGPGPGEFEDPTVLLNTGGVLTVLDGRARRASTFDGSGSLARESRLDSLGTITSAAVTSRGLVLGTRAYGDDLALALVHPDGMLLERFGRVPVPVSREEAAFMAPIVEAQGDTVYWGFQARPMIYRSRDMGTVDSINLGEDLITPWGDAPSLADGLERWTGENWTAIRAIHALPGNRIVVRMLRGSRRSGTRSQVLVVIDWNTRRVVRAESAPGPETWSSIGDTLLAVSVSDESGETSVSRTGRPSWLGPEPSS